jgi:protein involved in polysaccharide export with SLBB domain
LQSTPQPDPVVQPGDHLQVTVWQRDEFSGDFAVSSGGTLTHPILQSVVVGGATLSTARQQIVGAVAEHLREPDVRVELLVPVSVGGAVNQPDLYRLPHGSTIAQAIAEAGGATTDGRLDQVRLVRGNSAMTLDITTADLNYGRIPVASDDQIFVGRRSDSNVLRDVLVPLATLGTLGIAIANLVRD